MRQRTLARVFWPFVWNTVYQFGLRAWKGHDWQVMNSLHEKGYISNPATKAKSVALTEKGAKLSQEQFEKRFAMK